MLDFGACLDTSSVSSRARSTNKTVRNASLQPPKCPTSMILFLMISSRLAVTSSVMTGAGRCACSKSRSTSSALLTGRLLAVACRGIAQRQESYQCSVRGMHSSWGQRISINARAGHRQDSQDSSLSMTMIKHRPLNRSS
jgi:hypothetical protein